MGEPMDGTKPSDTKPKRRPGERLPKKVPREVRLFLLCKRMTLEFRGGKLDWLDISYKGFTLSSPDVTFEQNPDGTVKATASALGGIVNVNVTISVGADGQITATAGGATGSLIQDPIDEWVNDLNEDMKKNKRKIDKIEVKRGVLVITKAVVVAEGQAPAKPKETSKTAAWVAAGFVALATIVGGIIIANAGGSDDSTRPEAGGGGADQASDTTTQAHSAGIAAEFHDNNKSYVKVCVPDRVVEQGNDYEIVVRKVRDASGQPVPGSIPVSTIATAAADGIESYVEVTGQGPGTYEVTIKSRQPGGGSEELTATLGKEEGERGCFR